jgi:hypothetical protein
MRTGAVDPNTGPARRPRVVAVVAIAIVLSVAAPIAFLEYLIVSTPVQTPSPCCPYGPEVAVSSGSNGSSYSVAGVKYYQHTFSIQAASNGVIAEDFAFVLQAPNGTVGRFTFVALVDVSSCWVGSYSTSWTSGPSPASPPNSTACGASGPNLTSQISSGDQLVLVTESSIDGQGFFLVITGHGAFRGTITAAVP